MRRVVGWGAWCGVGSLVSFVSLVSALVAGCGDNTTGGRTAVSRAVRPTLARQAPGESPRVGWAVPPVVRRTAPPARPAGRWPAPTCSTRAQVTDYQIEMTADDWSKISNEFFNYAALEAAGQPDDTYHPIVFHYGGGR